MSWAAIVAGGVGLVETGIGAEEKHKANQRAAKLAASRPKESITPETKEAVALTASELGRPDYSHEDTEMANSINSILRGGGDPNNISELFSSDNAGRARMAMMNENIRLNKVNNFISSLRGEGEERQQVFGFNEWAPWADLSQANALQKQDANNLMFKGLDTAASAAAGYLYNKPKQPSNDTGFNFSQRSVDLAKTPGDNLATSNPNPATQSWQTPTFTSPQLSSRT